MAKSNQFKRLLAFAFLLATAMVALGYRLVDLQVLRHDELRNVAEHNTRSLVKREPLRGKIFDVRKNILATSIPAKRVCVDPTLLGTNQWEVARLLAPLLGTNEVWLAERLQPRVVRTGTNGVAVFDRYVVLKHKVPVETWRQIQEAMASLGRGEEAHWKPAEKLFYRTLRTSAVFAEDDQMRWYPNHALAAHVLGYVQPDESQKGLAGIERSLESQLAGIGGWRRTEKDRKGREVVAYRDQDVEARDGLNAVLTVDSGLQYILESELAEAMTRHSPISVSGLILRPATGEILAMATLPNFDPNIFWKAATADALKNRTISDVYEPGSTFKIVVVSAALNEGVVQLGTEFDCENGVFHFAKRILHDHEKYGMLSVERIITKSSNIGAAKVGIQLGKSRLAQYIGDFGFGSSTGLPLPGESRGYVRPTRDWYDVSIAQIPMGHGITVTPLQMAMAMSTIANKGKLMRPILVDHLEDEDGKVIARTQPQMIRQVISEAAAREMVTALKTVVAADGTAPKAHLDNYTVAGKTGTAQKVVNGAYSHDKFFASFIGFLPAGNPELCIAILLDEPMHGYYAGQTAAPFFKNVAERAANYLNLKPDALPAPAPREILAGAPTNTLAARH